MRRHCHSVQHPLVFPISESEHGISIFPGNTCASGIAGKRMAVTGAGAERIKEMIVCAKAQKITGP